MSGTGLATLLGEEVSGDELVEAEARYRLLIENIPLVTYIDATDDDSSAVYMSPQIEPLLGYSPQEWVENPKLFIQLLHLDDRKRVMTLVRRTNATGELFRAEYRLIARDGRIVWFRDESVHRFGQSGAYYLGFMMDITARKEAERLQQEAQMKYRNIVEHLPAIAYIVTPLALERRWHYVSPKSTPLIGYRPDELRADQKLWARLLCRDDRENVLAADHRLKVTGVYDVEYRLMGSDGVLHCFHDKGTPVLDDAGKLTRLQGVMLDVTAYRS